MSISQFQIDVGAETILDLQRRLSNVRWSDAVTDDWSYGTRKSSLMELVDYWRVRYDWTARQHALNALPHRRAEIDGFTIHFLHFRGEGSRPTPLLLMNGWPSSFVEYERLIPLLTSPPKDDPTAPTYDVIIPTLPGFGFSDRPTQPDQVNAIELFCRLMVEELGYKEFAVAGTDFGGRVATRIALRYPQAVTALHVATVDDPALTEDSPPLTAEEQAYLEQQKQWFEQEGAYAAVQSTRPQTLAFALADSPVGLASWILEKFHAWSDHEGSVFSVFPHETLLDNIMIYWLTETIGSSMRFYHERPKWRPPHRPGDYVSVPTGVLMLPKDLADAPLEWAERFYNVRRYARADRGGHFPGWEVPELYASELRQTLLS